MFSRMVNAVKEVIDPITKRNAIAIITSNLIWAVLCAVLIMKGLKNEKN